MDTTRRDTKIAGVLILVGMLAGALSIVPVLERPDYLTLISAHDSEIVLGAGAQLLMIPAYVGFALYLYPTPGLGDEALSRGFVGFRLIAAMFHFIGVILLPLFLILGEVVVQSAGGVRGPQSCAKRVASTQARRAPPFQSVIGSTA